MVKIMFNFYTYPELRDLSQGSSLESDDSNEVKKLFLEFAKQIRKNPLKIELKVDEEFDMNSNRLFYDASVEYVNQLNKELEILEIDEDLIEIRKY